MWISRVLGSRPKQPAVRALNERLNAAADESISLAEIDYKDPTRYDLEWGIVQEVSEVKSYEQEANDVDWLTIEYDGTTYVVITHLRVETSDGSKTLQATVPELCSLARLRGASALNELQSTEIPVMYRPNGTQASLACTDSRTDPTPIDIRVD